MLSSFLMRNNVNINSVVVQCSHALFDIKVMKSLCNIEPMINISNIAKLKVTTTLSCLCFLEN